MCGVTSGRLAKASICDALHDGVGDWALDAIQRVPEPDVADLRRYSEQNGPHTSVAHLDSRD